MGIARSGVMLGIIGGLILAQTFEVASVKPSGPNSVRGSEGGPGTRDPGRYSFGRADLTILIMIAYNVEDFQISSRFPLDRGEFDLVANVPPGATKEQFRIMLQNLLTERFHLRLRHESRKFPAYELAVAKTGPKLQAASAQSEPVPRSWLQDGFPDMPLDRPGLRTMNLLRGQDLLIRMKGQGQPLTRLAEILRIATEQPVVERTGIAGKFDFTLEFTREGFNSSPDTAATPAGADVNSALQQQLGLQLVKKQLPFDVLVIESVDRLPTGN